jgi:hypothetical protein
MLAGMLTAQLVPIYLDRRRQATVAVQQEPAGHH